MNLLNGGVTRGLVGAATNMKLAGVSMAVYEVAKAKKDKDAMEKAKGYATDLMDQANKCCDEAREALKDAQVDAKKQEEQQQQNVSQSTTATTTTDTVEISREAQTVSNGAWAATGSLSQNATVASDISQTYTSEGDIKTATDSTISVKA